MIHLTLLTGDSRESPRAEVADHVIDYMRGLLLPGEHDLPVMGGYRLVVPTCPCGWLGTVQQDRVPIATIGVAANEAEADAIWPALVKVQQAVAQVTCQRPPSPWVCAALLASSPAFDWLGDFGRCIAWAWMESI